jgi:hypothetical protein
VATPYVIRLAPGVYIDSAGNLVGAPSPATPVYSPPFELPVDPAKLKEPLKEVSEALTGLKKNKTVMLSLHVWGVENNYKLLEFLLKVGELAENLSKVAGALAIGVSVLKLFGFLKDGPNALEQLVNKRFDELSAQNQAITQILQQNLLGVAGGALEKVTGDIAIFAQQTPQLSLAAYLSKQQELRTTHNNLLLNMTAPLRAATWLQLIDKKEFNILGQMQGTVFTVPQDTIASRVAAVIPAAAFPDLRLMVPMVTLAAERYLTCLRALLPEYRSTGDYRGDLKAFAEGIEGRASDLRQFTLARTFHQPGHFQTVYQSEVDAGWLGLGEPRLNHRCTRWRVGALDIMLHNDSFFDGFKNQFDYAMLYDQVPQTTRHACMDFAWKPPAKLANLDAYGWQITNPQECADAANEQAERDYAALLVLSGYPELMRLSALCRQMAAEPKESETVKMAEPGLLFQKVAEGPVDVVSTATLGFMEVKAKARQETRNCSAVLKFRTQSLKRAQPHLRYRVALRTLAELAPYGDYYVAQYASQPDGEGIQVLDIGTRDTLRLGEVWLLPAWTESPDAALYREDSFEIQADTYNWYIPVSNLFESSNGQLPSLEELRAWGSKYVKPPKIDYPDPLPKDPTEGESDGDTRVLDKVQWVDPLPGLAWRAAASDADRSARHRERKYITIRWALDWEGDELTVTLQSDAAARSFVVFVVIEEELTRTRNVLHTAMPVPMDGLVSFVPKSFFEKEAEAVAAEARAIATEVAVDIPDLGDLRPPRPEELAPFKVVNPLVLRDEVATIRQQNAAVHDGLMSRVRDRLNG